jgi:hypothetical protein
LTRPHRHQSRLTGGLSSPSRQAEQNGPSPYLHHIVGWPVPEGRILLYDLTLHATRPEFVYSHEWQVGDLVIWDNRCTMDRGHRTTMLIPAICAAQQPSTPAPPSTKRPNPTSGEWPALKAADERTPN